MNYKIICLTNIILDLTHNEKENTELSKRTFSSEGFELGYI